MSSLQDVSQAMAALVEEAGGGVVRVEGRRRMAASGIVWSADGLILTAHHVVRRDEEICVGLPDGTRVDATLVGRDPGTDLALLKVTADGLTVPAWVDTGELRVGHLALALGRPGHTVQATLGVVSALGGEWRTGAGGRIDRYLQTDVLMYPGFSGGPLVAADGRIAGLNSSGLTRGASVAVPAETVRRVAGALSEHGRIKRGYLGVGLQPVRLAANLQKETGQETGLMLLSVEDGSPAANGGLSQGDIIVALDGCSVSHPDALHALLSGDRVGQEVPVRVARGGALVELTVVIGEK